MELYKTQDGLYVARTQYGEWAAKQKGFTWKKDEQVWTTTDPQKALELSAETGLSYASALNLTPPPPPTSPTAKVNGDLWPTVLAGRYAVVDPVTKVLKFYRVDKPKEGKWMGYTFVKVMASDTLYPIKDHVGKKIILDLIARYPLDAMAKYGTELGECGYCGKTLTDAESRQIGIGPVCRKKINWTGAAARGLATENVE